MSGVDHFGEKFIVTGEMLGMKYLYAQSGIVLAEKEEEVNQMIDEGIVADDDSAILEEEIEDPLDSIIARDHGETQQEEVNIEVCLMVLTSITQSLFLFPVIIDNVSFIFVQEELEEKDNQEAVDSKGLPGWDRVDKLAEALINMEGLFVTNTKAEKVKRLYDNLLDYDKQPLKYQPMCQQHSSCGRFARNYRLGHVGVERMKR